MYRLWSQRRRPLVVGGAGGDFATHSESRVLQQLDDPGPGGGKPGVRSSLGGACDGAGAIVYRRQMGKYVVKCRVERVEERERGGGSCKSNSGDAGVVVVGKRSVVSQPTTVWWSG